MKPPDLVDRLEALVEFLPRLEDAGFRLGSWAGGDRRPDGSITMPYYELGAEGLALVGALGAWVEPFDWMAWLQTDDGRSMSDDAERMAKATPEDLSRIITAIVRSERFGDGNLEGALGSGLLLRIVLRARGLLEAERARGRGSVRRRRPSGGPR